MNPNVGIEKIPYAKVQLLYIIFILRLFYFKFVRVFNLFLFYLLGYLPIYINEEITTIKAYVYNQISQNWICMKENNNHDELHEAMNTLDKLFTKNNIKYWATAGTLLGVARHNDILAHDNDIDICVHYDQLDEILKLGEGYFFQMGLDRLLHKFHSNIDILVMIKSNNIIMYLKTPIHSINEYYYADEVNDIVNLPFGKYKISCIANYKNFLVRSFGYNYLSNICLKIVHIPNLKFNTKNAFQAYIIKKYGALGYSSGGLTWNIKPNKGD